MPTRIATIDIAFGTRLLVTLTRRSPRLTGLLRLRELNRCLRPEDGCHTDGCVNRRPSISIKGLSPLNHMADAGTTFAPLNHLAAELIPSCRVPRRHGKGGFDDFRVPTPLRHRRTRHWQTRESTK